MKRFMVFALLLSLLLGLTACGQEEAAQPAGASSYIYEFQGMMGPEKAQIDLLPDGTCKFSLPGNPVIKDVYVGTYTKEGNQVSITGLKNEDPNSQFPEPTLWDWISQGNAQIVLDESAMTFTPAAGASGEDGHPEGGRPEGGKPQSQNPPEGAVRVSYAQGSEAQYCDIYTPENADKAPVILLVHGGGFMFGDPTMEVIQPVIQAALEKGYAVVSVDYRKASEACFPAALADVKAAVRFVKANAQEYGFDPDRVVAWGESAGAYLSLMTALTPEVSQLNGDVTENLEVSSQVAALVSFYAPVEFYTLYQEAGKPEAAADSFESKFLGQDITLDETVTYTTYWETYKEQLPDSVHAWIQAGDGDQKVPCTQSQNFAQRLAEYYGEENVTFQLIPGADHEDDLFYTQENLDAVFAWLDTVLQG